MKRVLLASLCVLFISGVVSADIVQGIEIDFVTIGNPGNPGDTRTDSPDRASPYGAGAVDYIYKIGKYEVTNNQWNQFVSASGAPTGNAATAYDSDAYWKNPQAPANSVSWYEATQFCNYLTSGDKSIGAYIYSGNNTNPGDFLEVDRESAMSTFGTIYVLPSQDEWYKAAFYNGSGYSTYTNGTNTIPLAGVEANYEKAIGNPWNVGSGEEEINGTFDMIGNVWERQENLVSPNHPNRLIRGGSYLSSGTQTPSATRYSDIPEKEGRVSGFRIAAIPEPCSLVLLSFGGLILRRKA